MPRVQDSSSTTYAVEARHKADGRVAWHSEGFLALEFAGQQPKAFTVRSEPLGGVTRVHGKMVERSESGIIAKPLCVALRDEDGMALCIALASAYGIRLLEAVEEQSTAIP